MFPPKKAKANPTSDAISIITAGTSIEGNMNVQNSLRVDGEVFGDIRVKHKVLVGANAKVVGNIYCESAEIQGVVEGNIASTDLIEIKEQAQISGDISYSQIQIDAGASLQSKLILTTDKKDNIVDMQDFQAVTG